MITFSGTESYAEGFQNLVGLVLEDIGIEAVDLLHEFFIIVIVGINKLKSVILGEGFSDELRYFLYSFGVSDIILQAGTHGNQHSDTPDHVFRTDMIEEDANNGYLTQCLVKNQVEEQIGHGSLRYWSESLLGPGGLVEKRSDIVDHGKIVSKYGCRVGDHGEGET